MALQPSKDNGAMTSPSGMLAIFLYWIFFSRSFCTISGQSKISLRMIGGIFSSLATRSYVDRTDWFEEEEIINPKA